MVPQKGPNNVKGINTNNIVRPAVNPSSVGFAIRQEWISGFIIPLNRYSSSALQMLKLTAAGFQIHPTAASHYLWAPSCLGNRMHLGNSLLWPLVEDRRHLGNTINGQWALPISVFDCNPFCLQNTMQACILHQKSDFLVHLFCILLDLHYL